jgi:hypothetical protein
MNLPRPFISFSQQDGTAFAQRMRDYCEKKGLDAWFYPLDKTAGALTWTEIANQILKRNVAIIIVTKGSHTSDGQRKECNIIVNSSKPVCILRASDAEMLPELRWANWDVFSEVTFDEQCAEAVRKLPKIIRSHRKR